MLTPQHLEILRAALQYFDEELSPHGTEAISNYVNHRPEEPVTPQHIKRLRDMLGHCQLRYAVYDRRTLKLTSDSLFESFDQVVTQPKRQGTATLLFSPTDD